MVSIILAIPPSNVYLGGRIARSNNLWMFNGREHVKLMLENFLKLKGKDPSLPDTWYPLSWPAFASLNVFLSS